MSKNSFEELAKENEAKFVNSSVDVKRNIQGRKDLWTLIGDLFELYIPRLFGAFLGGRGVSSKTGISSSDDE